MEVSIQSSTEIVQKQYAVSLLLLTYSESSGALTTNYGSAAVLFETLKQANHLPSLPQYSDPWEEISFF